MDEYEKHHWDWIASALSIISASKELIQRSKCCFPFQIWIDFCLVTWQKNRLQSKKLPYIPCGSAMMSWRKLSWDLLETPLGTPKSFLFFSCFLGGGMISCPEIPCGALNSVTGGIQGGLQRVSRPYAPGKHCWAPWYIWTRPDFLSGQTFKYFSNGFKVTSSRICCHSLRTTPACSWIDSWIDTTSTTWLSRISIWTNTRKKATQSQELFPFIKAYC